MARPQPVRANSPQAIELGTLGGTNSWAYGINNLGQVVGTSFLEDTGSGSQEHAFLWGSGEMVDLGTLAGADGDFSGALDINDSTQIVGQSRNELSDDMAFLWQEGVMIQLPGLEPETFNTAATAINDAGVAVGWSHLTSHCPPEEGTWHHAVKWEGGEVVDLGTLGGCTSEALSINNRGQIVGTSETSTGEIHAFLWEDGNMVDLGAIPGWPSDWEYSSANMINNRGTIIGVGGDPVEESHSLRWYRGEFVTFEDFYPTISESDVWPLDVNEPGVIVGHYWPQGWPAFPLNAFVFDKNTFTDLSSYWGTPGVAWAVNNDGWVAGEGTIVVEIPDPESIITEEFPQAFLWIP